MRGDFFGIIKKQPFLNKQWYQNDRDFKNCMITLTNDRCLFCAYHANEMLPNLKDKCYINYLLDV